MYFLIMAIKKGYTVVYESVELNKSWVFSKNGSRVISKRKINDQDDPELKSKQTVHIFDATAGNNSYGITRIVNGAKQVVFSSTNRASYAQFIRNYDVFEAFLPSTSKEEFNRYVSLFGVSNDKVDEVVRVSGHGKVRPLQNFEKQIDRVESAIKEFDLKKISTYTSTENTILEAKAPLFYWMHYLL